jgi:hypothetical protein
VAGSEVKTLDIRLPEFLGLFPASPDPGLRMGAIGAIGTMGAGSLERLAKVMVSAGGLGGEIAVIKGAGVLAGVPGIIGTVADSTVLGGLSAALWLER